MLPPPIQGIGNCGGFTMQVELRDGSVDCQTLQASTDAIVADAAAQSRGAACRLVFRAEVPQFQVEVDRVKAETMQVPVGDVFKVLSAISARATSNQFNKFGRTFQVYVQADARFR